MHLNNGAFKYHMATTHNSVLNLELLVDNTKIVGFVLFLDSFLNSCGCSTAKSKTPPQETIFFTHLPVQSLGPNHPWPLMIENWFLF